MTVRSDPAVGIATVATAMKSSEHTITAHYMAGGMPPPDSLVRDVRGLRKTRAWRLSTLHTWRPDVADRCAAILAALEQHPLEHPLKPAPRTPAKAA